MKVLCTFVNSCASSVLRLAIMNDEIRAHEKLSISLHDTARRTEFLTAFDSYRPTVLARALAAVMTALGDLVYGKAPSYQKIKAIEIMARVPYESWEMGVYTLLTGLYTNEKRAMELANINAFSRVAQDNETMHVIVMTQLVRRHDVGNFVLHTLFPFLTSFGYFVTVYILYLVYPKSALDLNYLFEKHAFGQYSRFIEEKGEELKSRPVESAYLTFYGRTVSNELELFQLFRNDELIHRNRSAEAALRIRTHRVKQ
jgi:ubiquinol oxidase